MTTLKKVHEFLHNSFLHEERTGTYDTAKAFYDMAALVEAAQKVISEISMNKQCVICGEIDWEHTDYCALAALAKLEAERG